MYSRTLTSLIFSCALIGLAAPSGDSQEAVTQEPERIVEAVEVQGNRRVRDEDILYYVKTRPGQPFSRRQAEVDLESVRGVGFFHPEATRLLVEDGERGGVVVIFEVMELPVIRAVRFEGLRGVTERDALVALRKKRSGVAEGGPAHPDKLRRAKTIIEELLAEGGWPEAEVELRQEVESPTAVTIRFVSKERP